MAHLRSYCFVVEVPFKDSTIKKEIFNNIHHVYNLRPLTQWLMHDASPYIIISQRKVLVDGLDTLL